MKLEKQFLSQQRQEVASMEGFEDKDEEFMLSSRADKQHLEEFKEIKWPESFYQISDRPLGSDSKEITRDCGESHARQSGSQIARV